MAKKKYIETPEILWGLFLDYKKHAKQNPKFENVLSNRTGEVVGIPREIPLTTEGFENYLFDRGIINDLGDYFSNKNDAYSNYSTICTRIKQNIRQDQIEGGMANLYNSSITQRLNNLVEKQQTEITGGLNIPNLPDIGNR